MRAAVTAVCMALLMLLAPAAQAAGPYPPPMDEHAEVSATRVQAGECVIFSGGGFEPGSEVTIYDNDELVGVTRADKNGDFRYEVCFDVDARPGRHTLKAVGLGADGAPLTLTATVFVTGVSQRPGPGTGPGRGTGTDGGSEGPGVPSATPTSSPEVSPATPSATPSAAPEPSRPQAAPPNDGLSFTGWLILLSLLAFLALLSALLLLARRRGREDEEPDLLV